MNWTTVFPAKQKTGLAIILLGNNPTQDTITGDPGRDENKKYGLAQYVNSRFWDIPLEVTIDQYENYTDRTQWPTAPVGTRNASATKQGRKPSGLKRVILENNCTATTRFPKRGLEASGTFSMSETTTLPGVRVHWWLAKEAPQWRGDIPTMPMLGILHSAHQGISEIYDLSAVGDNNIVANARHRMSRFVGAGPVASRLAIIFEPLTTKRFSIFAESSRTKVMFENEISGAQNMPWDDWALAWEAHTPPAVKAAVDAYFDNMADKDDSPETMRDLIALGTTHAARLHKIAAQPGVLADGAVFGKPAAAPSRRGANRTTGAKKSPAAKATGKDNDSDNVSSIDDKQNARVTKLGLVMCRIIEEPTEEFVVRYDRTTRQTLLNVQHPMFRNIVDSIVGEYIATGRLKVADTGRRGAIEGILRREAVKHLTLAGTQAVATAAATPTEAESILSPYALQATLYGLRHLETLSAKAIGHTIGGKRKTPVRKTVKAA